MAPEVHKAMQYNHMVDVFSVALIFWELFAFRVRRPCSNMMAPHDYVGVGGDGGGDDDDDDGDGDDDDMMMVLMMMMPMMVVVVMMTVLIVVVVEVMLIARS